MSLVAVAPLRRHPGGAALAAAIADADPQPVGPADTALDEGLRRGAGRFMSYAWLMPHGEGEMEAQTE